MWYVCLLTAPIIAVYVHFQTKDLLPYEGSCCPIVKRTGRGEFLLNTGAFGILVSVATGGSNVMEYILRTALLCLSDLATEFCFNIAATS